MIVKVSPSQEVDRSFQPGGLLQRIRASKLNVKEANCCEFQLGMTRQLNQLKLQYGGGAEWSSPRSHPPLSPIGQFSYRNKLY